MAKQKRMKRARAAKPAAAAPVVETVETFRARDQRPAAGKAPPPLSSSVLGDRVKVTTGDFASSRGTIEAITPKGVTVRVHARLAVTVPASDVQAV